MVIRAFWKFPQAIFERFDRDRGDKIVAKESEGCTGQSKIFALSPEVLDLLVSKFDKAGRKNKAMEYIVESFRCFL
ncbi:hypothetical protein EUGRSUZ_K01570 [Eucalyptus grandis]|uniref:Uncharacterized protein n=2 Tax=Eucalyptus grandis TaxID=71139 RepID=A0ACC3IUA3_EUCGR|nr:hypothetical protein EUGRSUZ_K01570 [Eucalyptus grandis]